MTATLDQARDEILGVLKAAWDVGVESTGLPMQYPNIGGQEPPVSGAWGRATVRHTAGFQATLRGAVGERRFRHLGTVTVQLFVPSGEGQGLSDALAKIVMAAFEGVTTSPGHVIFRNVKTVEIGPDGQFFQVNALAEFEYDEVR